MRSLRKFHHLFFALFFFGGIFGIFFIVLLYLHYKTPDTAPFAASDYVIPSVLSDEAPNTLFYTFEKNMPSQACVSELAHEGKASLAFPAGIKNSVINIPLGNWSEAQLKEILVKGFMFQKAGAKPAAASLVVLISNPVNDILFSKKIPIRGNPVQQWFEFNITLHPAAYHYSSDDRLCIYVINQSGKDILMDDVDVQFAGDLMIAESFKARQSSTLGDSNFFKLASPRLLLPLLRDISLTSGDSTLSSRATARLSNNEEIVIGNFTTNNSSSTQLLLRDSKGFILCSADEKGKAVNFSRMECLAADSISEEVSPASGDFDGDGMDELICASSVPGKLYLMKPFIHKDLLRMQTRVILSGLPDCQDLLALRNAGQNAVLLCIASDGNYSILKPLKNGGMTASAPLKGPSCWNRRYFTTTFIALPPSGNSRTATLLCGYSKTGSSDQGMILLETDAANSELHVLKALSDGVLPQFNLSLIHDADRLFPLPVRGKSYLQFLRVREDFRYDVQLIRLGRDGRWECTPLDFARQGDEDNPKYNPVCRVIPLADSPRGLLCMVITRAGEHARPQISIYLAAENELQGN